MIRRCALAVACWLTLFGSATAFAQDDVEGHEDPPVDAGDAQPEADDEPGYEPDQRGVDEGPGGDTDEVPDDLYEPDQRGYEPDQRGYAEPAQMRQAEESEPMPASVDALESGDGGSSSDRDHFEIMFWLGGGVTSLGAIQQDNLVRPFQLDGGAGTFGLSAGIRFDRLSIGPRLEFAVHDAFSLGTFGLDLRVDLLMTRLAPYLRASLGYAAVIGTGSQLPSVHGLDAELGVGFLGHVSPHFLLGAEVSGTYLHLLRDGASDCTSSCTSGAFDLTAPGSGDGLGIRVRLMVGTSF